MTMTHSTTPYDNSTTITQVMETVVYPGCQRGMAEENYPHRFRAALGPDEWGQERALLFCEACGQVRKLVYEP